MGSTAPDARAAILDLLEARTGTGEGLEGVTVLARPPVTESEAVGEVVHLGRWDTGVSTEGQGVQSIITGGSIAWDETYVAWVSVQVVGTTTADTETTMSERAWALAAEVIGAVSTEPDLGLVNDTTRLRCHVAGYAFDEATGRRDRSGAYSRIAIGLTIDGRVRLT